MILNNTVNNRWGRNGMREYIRRLSL
jgi:hypothetical protein